MQTIKLLLLSLLLTYQISLSQTIYPSTLLDSIRPPHHTIYSTLPKLNNLLNEENIMSSKITKLNTTSRSVIDSLIVTAKNGDKIKNSYTYNPLGKIVEHINEKWQINKWINSQREKFIFEEKGKITNFIAENWEENQWVGSFQEITTYNQNDQITLSQRENWKNNNWEISSRYIYTYDSLGYISMIEWGVPSDSNQSAWSGRAIYKRNSRGNVIYQFSEVWNGFRWHNVSRTYTDFDSSDKMVSQLFEYWDNANQKWINEARINLEYNEDGRRTTFVEERWSNEQWLNDRKHNSIYNEDGRLEITLEERWSNEEWVNYKKWVKSSKSNIDLSTFYKWEINKWDKTYEYRHTLNSMRQITKREYEKWENMQTIIYEEVNNTLTAKGAKFKEVGKYLENDQLVRTWQNDYTYDDSKNLILFLSDVENKSLNSSRTFGIYVRDLFGNSFSEQGAKIELFYNSLTDVNEEDQFIKDFSLSQNYPNPFNPTTTIKYSLPFQREMKSTVKNVTLKVYDILGKEIVILVNEIQKSGNHQVSFNGNDLSSGVYFYRLQAGEFTETKKLLLMK